MKICRQILIVILACGVAVLAGCTDTAESTPQSSVAPETTADPTAAPTAEPAMVYDAETLLSEGYGYFSFLDAEKFQDAEYTVTVGGYNHYELTYSQPAEPDEIGAEILSILNLDEENRAALTEWLSENQNVDVEGVLNATGDTAHMEALFEDGRYWIDIVVLGESDFSRYEPFFSDNFDADLFGDAAMMQALMDNMIIQKSVTADMSADNLDIAYAVGLTDDYDNYAEYYRQMVAQIQASGSDGDEAGISVNENSGNAYLYFKIGGISCNVILYDGIRVIELTQHLALASAGSEGTEETSGEPTDGSAGESVDETESADPESLAGLGFEDHIDEGHYGYRTVTEDAKDVYIAVYKTAWGNKENMVCMDVDGISFAFFPDSRSVEIWFQFPDTDFVIAYDASGSAAPGEGWSQADVEAAITGETGQTFDDFSGEYYRYFMNCFMQLFGKTPEELYALNAQ